VFNSEGKKGQQKRPQRKVGRLAKISKKVTKKDLGLTSGRGEACQKGTRLHDLRKGGKKGGIRWSENNSATCRGG